jgi:hypothetical protein
MTGWGVERKPRTARLVSTWDEPTGDSALMPPHSQGAERRTERPARHTGSRWGLRTLVIGGLAGAAWLLTGAAAHAADRTPAPDGPGFLGSVVSGDIAAQPTVGRILQAAAQPLEIDRVAHRHHRTPVLDVPIRVLYRPATTVTHQHRQHTGSTAVLDGVDRAIREITGPLRLTGGPADSSPEPVTVPFTRTMHPVVDALPQAVNLPPAEVPVMTAQRPITTPVVNRPRAVHGKAAELSPVTSAVSASRRHAAPARSTRKTVHRHAVLDTVPGPETARESTPGGDDPAPLQGHLGGISGISTTGSGAQTEAGSPAFIPAAIVASSMAFHRLPIVTGVEPRPHDAEAPTVSPD